MNKDLFPKLLISKRITWQSKSANDFGQYLLTFLFLALSVIFQLGECNWGIENYKKYKIHNKHTKANHQSLFTAQALHTFSGHKKARSISTSSVLSSGISSGYTTMLSASAATDMGMRMQLDDSMTRHIIKSETQMECLNFPLISL